MRLLFISSVLLLLSPVVFIGAVLAGDSALLEAQLKLGTISVYGGNKTSWKNFFMPGYALAQHMPMRQSPPPKGDTWPLPLHFTPTDQLYDISPQDLSFETKLASSIDSECKVLDLIIARFKHDWLLFKTARPVPIDDAVLDPGDVYSGATKNTGQESTGNADPLVGNLKHSGVKVNQITINLNKRCSDYPTKESVESYDLTIDETGIVISADEVWGVNWGLETLCQLIYGDYYSKNEHSSLFKVRGATIKDEPRFGHRGLLIDTGRHFLPKSSILTMLDAMAMNKLNILHWHIVDDNSFPLHLASYPDFTSKAAYSPFETYSSTDISEIVAHARVRGIQVMPEIDTPGHVFSWRHLPVEILTRCYDNVTSLPNGDLGPLDPTNEKTYEVVKQIITEVSQLFRQTPLFHVGGDEVQMDCWLSNPNIRKFYIEMKKKQGIVVNDSSIDEHSMHELVTYYNKRLIELIRSIDSGVSEHRRIFMWEEGVTKDGNADKSLIAHVWYSNQTGVANITADGYNVIYSTCWYLDRFKYADWVDHYLCDPVKLGNLSLSIDEEKVLGGEACMWGEYVDETNIMQVTWPRGSAAAERLWSSKEAIDVEYAGRRYEEHRCRMISRGIAASPSNGPGTCNSNYFFRSKAAIINGQPHILPPKTASEKRPQMPKPVEHAPVLPSKATEITDGRPLDIMESEEPADFEHPKDDINTAPNTKVGQAVITKQTLAITAVDETSSSSFDNNSSMIILFVLVALVMLLAFYFRIPSMIARHLFRSGHRRTFTN